MTFADLKVGQTFWDTYINERHTVIEPQRVTKDNRRECPKCHAPAERWANARASDGSLVHLCPEEEVRTERVEVAA